MRAPALLFIPLALSLACAPRMSTVPIPPHPPVGASAPRPAIVQVGASVLRTPAAEVPAHDLNTPALHALVSRMLDTMRTAPGVGLAAPQIGESRRIFVLEDRAELIAKLTPVEQSERARQPFAARVFVNPVVRPVGDEVLVFFEGCLSLSGYVGLVPRSAEVEVQGTDEHGTPQTWRVRGWPARILQHEYDHLQGTLYIDRMLTRSFSTAEAAKARFSGLSIDEVRRQLGL